jgi:cell division protein FtsI/penicillin-binding protein 2/cell division protein FtsW (lipid II flippase)
VPIDDPGRRLPPAVPKSPRLHGRRRTRKGSTTADLLAVAALLVLVVLGLANFYVVDGPDTALWQGVIAAAGFLAIAFLWRFQARALTVLAWLSYGLAVVLLAAVLVVGVSVNGATRWIRIGPVTFQPSELAKLGLLLALAGVLGSARPAWQRFTAAVGLAALPIGLTLVQPDLSTTTLLVVLAATMIVIGRVSARFLIPLLGAAAVAAPLAIGLLRPYQVERLGSFLVGSHQEAEGAGWAVQQARIAIGTGSWFGRAGEPLTPLLAQYLPERDTDLALAGLVLQFGLVAAAAALIAAVVLVWRAALGCRHARTRQGALVAGGMAILLGVEVVVSVGGNLGLLPLAGVPFPLMSNGGTAVLVHLVAFGVVLGLQRDGARRPLWATPRRPLRRPRLVRTMAVGLTGLLVVFATYTWNVQQAQGALLYAAGQDQMTRCLRIPAQRGAITDRHGTVLATSTGDGALQDVVVVPALLRSRPGDVERLAALTGQPADGLRATLDAAPDTTIGLALAQVPPAVGATVAAAGLDAVWVVPPARRTYPTGPVLGPVLGFAGVATPAETVQQPDLPPGVIVGRAGLEQQYDAVLRGLDGEQCVYVTPKGVPAALGPRTEPAPGADLRLSLDLGLQERLTAGLRNAVGPRRNAVGAAVALDPRTGQLLALASMPSYDNAVYGPPVDVSALRALANAPGHPQLEKASQAALPPGSTFKLVVAAAATQHGVIPPDAVVPTGGSFTYGGHTFGNWRPMGPMDLRQSIAMSNDVYFYKLAVALGPERIAEAARALGVGARTGIDLPGESAGYLGTPDSVEAKGGAWYGGSTVILGIGQGELQLTPLQVAQFTTGVSTGHTVTPRLGLATGTTGNPFTALPAPAPAPVPFADRLAPIRDGMRAAVTSGTAGSLAGMPVPVGAKTGTAQDGSLPPGQYDNWMTAAAPHDAPRVVMTAVVQGPGTGANSGEAVVADGLAHYLANEAAITATDPVAPAP